MIEDVLLGIVRRILEKNDLVMNDEMSADDVDGWDSLTHVRIILEIEKEFKIRFSTTQIGSLENWGDLKTLVASKVDLNA